MDPHRKSDGRRKKDNSDKSVVEDLLQNVSQSVDKTLGVESIGQANKEATSSKDIAGDFDIYLFAQVWTPRFCCTKQKQCAEEQHKNDLTVHGLWPARQANSTYPTYCANNNNLPIPSKDKLAIHEWKKHGTCSTLTFDQYVNESIKIESTAANINSLRDYLNENAGGMVATNAIFQHIGGNKKVAVMSNKYCQLQEITTCFSKNKDGTINEQIDCPKHVLSGGRNSAVIYHGCKQLALDSIEADKCRYITKELLNILKGKTMNMA